MKSVTMRWPIGFTKQTPPLPQGLNSEAHLHSVVTTMSSCISRCWRYRSYWPKPERAGFAYPLNVQKPAF